LQYKIRFQNDDYSTIRRGVFVSAKKIHKSSLKRDESKVSSLRRLPKVISKGVQHLLPFNSEEPRSCSIFLSLHPLIVVVKDVLSENNEEIVML